MLSSFKETAISLYLSTAKTSIHFCFKYLEYLPPPHPTSIAFCTCLFSKISLISLTIYLESGICINWMAVFSSCQKIVLLFLSVTSYVLLHILVSITFISKFSIVSLHISFCFSSFTIAINAGPTDDNVKNSQFPFS